MHVGLNLVYLVPGEVGGMETYARELLPALVEERPDIRFTAFVGREGAADHTGPWHSMPCITVPVSSRRRVDWVRAEQQLLPRLARREQIDVLHSFASTGTLWGPYRRVVTIHDLLFMTVPQAHARVRSAGMRLLVPLAARRSHRIIAPSGTTRDDLVRLLTVPPDKIDVVPHGVRPPDVEPAETRAETRSRLALGSRPVVLTLSARRPHKNLDRLLGALASIPADRRPVLVLPGYRTSWEGALRERAAALGIADDTRFLGWVSETELEALYQVATCAVIPSLYEGFGLPVLEAMAHGLPVACSARTSLAEVAGGAALLFDAAELREIAGAIETLVRDKGEARRLSALGLARAKTFTWSAAAQATAAAYGRALGEGAPSGASVRFTR